MGYAHIPSLGFEQSSRRVVSLSVLGTCVKDQDVLPLEKCVFSFASSCIEHLVYPRTSIEHEYNGTSAGHFSYLPFIISVERLAGLEMTTEVLCEL